MSERFLLINIFHINVYKNLTIDNCVQVFIHHFYSYLTTNQHSISNDRIHNRLEP